jgi:predicted secreted protein
MKFTTIAAAAALSLGACAGQTGGEDVAPVAADSRFDTAANFVCEGGGKLDVLFYQADDGVLVRHDGGEAQSLTLDQNGGGWKSGATVMAMDMNRGGDVVTWTEDGKSANCKFESRALPAPKLDGVKQTLTVDDAGKSIEIKVGEKVAVALSGVPTAGYVWAASAPPAWVTATEGPGGSTSSAQLMPGFVGGSHWETVVIEAKAAGEGEIVLAQRRPWEDAAEPDAATFKFKLKAS